MASDTYTTLTDPGIDDILALALLHKLTSKANHTVISSFGNAPEPHTFTNAQECLALLGSHSWQLAHGPQLPLAGQLNRPWPTYFHGPDGLWQTHPEVDTSTFLAADQNSLTDIGHLISLGPLTSLNQVLITHRSNITDVTIMAGAFHHPGNETPYAEANLAYDPDAAAEFFTNCQSIPVRVVPLDVTSQVAWPSEQANHIPDNSPINRWIKQLIIAWYANCQHEAEPEFNLHDPLAVYLHFFPDCVKWQTTGVEVILEGEQRGKTQLNHSQPPCKIALELNQPPKQIADHIFEILFT